MTGAGPLAAAFAAAFFMVGTVADRPIEVSFPDGAVSVASVARQVERATGERLGAPVAAIALDTGGRRLTPAEIAEVVAGRPVPGVEVLGIVSGDHLAGGLMVDLADGVIDGVASRKSLASSRVVVYPWDTWDVFGLDCWWTANGGMTCALVDVFEPLPAW